MAKNVFVLLIMPFMKETVDFVLQLQSLMLIKLVACVILPLKYSFQKEGFVKSAQPFLTQMLIKLNVSVTKTIKKMIMIDVFQIVQPTLNFVMDNVSVFKTTITIMEFV